MLHRSFGLDTRFDEEGVELRPLLARPNALRWEAVEFVCPTPTMERGPTGWRPRDFSRYGIERPLLDSHGRLSLALVIKDRRRIQASAQGALTRYWLRRHLRAMAGADDRRKPDPSLSELDLSVKRLNAPVDALFDLLERRSRFDLVVFDL